MGRFRVLATTIRSAFLLNSDQRQASVCQVSSNRNRTPPADHSYSPKTAFRPFRYLNNRPDQTPMGFTIVCGFAAREQLFQYAFGAFALKTQHQALLWRNCGRCSHQAKTSLRLDRHLPRLGESPTEAAALARPPAEIIPSHRRYKRAVAPNQIPAKWVWSVTVL